MVFKHRRASRCWSSTATVRRIAFRRRPDSAPTDDGQWRAEFVWDGVPVGVDSAVLELGPNIVIELPPPGKAEAQALDVRVTPRGPRSPCRLDCSPPNSRPRSCGRRWSAPSPSSPAPAVTSRASAPARAADAERFRDGLAQVQAAAEQAIARGRREQAESDGEALRAQAADADDLQQRLSAVEDAGTEAGELRADARAAA